MTQMGELVAIPGIDKEFECPFEHEEGKKGDRKNQLPAPPEVNDSGKLKGNLGGTKATSIRVRGEDCNVLYTAHHLIPGNETWPKTRLYGWFDHRDSDGGISSKVNADIGYDVNDAKNGIYLGDDQCVPDAIKMGIKKIDYVDAFMHEKKCQWHDSHQPYSEFVVNQLNKIAERLDELTKTPNGCGKDYCGGARKSGDKVDPPYFILSRVHAVARRLRMYLSRKPEDWVLPLVTSKYVVAFREKSGLPNAKARLDALKARYVEDASRT